LIYAYSVHPPRHSLIAAALHRDAESRRLSLALTPSFPREKLRSSPFFQRIERGCVEPFEEVQIEGSVKERPLAMDTCAVV